MRVVVAIDSFKGSLTSVEAGNAVKEAILSLDAKSDVVVKSLADGGEGTVDAIASSVDSEIIELSVCGPIERPVIAKYCIIKETKTAVVEMAAAAGITLISKNERNPLETTTYGVGQIILDAIQRGCRRFIVGIGGSATNDGGTGMLSALGFSFLDGEDNLIDLGAKGLKNLVKIDDSHVLPELYECSFIIACDVKNPLCGESGCSAVFGRQKGATDSMITEMDRWLENYSEIAKDVNPSADKDSFGAGAAGGLGFAFSTFLNSRMLSGIDIVLDEIQLEKEIINADLIVTGEGRLDFQTAMGKAPIGVAKLAKKYSKKVIAFSGCIGDGAEECNYNGIDAYFPILREITTLENALNSDYAYKNLKSTAEQVFRIILNY